MNTDIDRAIAALMPQQREAWRIQWLIYHTVGGTKKFDAWLRRRMVVALRIAEKRLQAHEC